MGNWQSQQIDDVSCDQLYRKPVNIPEHLRDLEYDYENLVMEGGGAKVFAYLGGLKVLEKVGILRKIKRFAGSSGGAIFAALLAVGYDVRDLFKITCINLENFAQADSWLPMWLSFPLIISNYGWLSGKRLHDYIEEWVEKKTGQKGYTFGQLYRDRGTELCITATNVNRMSLELFHPKTTPDMTIAMAVQMSSAVPGLYQPIQYTKDSLPDYYIDGGVLSNFPIHVFDGWYMSMKPEDSYLLHLDRAEEPFKDYNKKTLGMLVYSTYDRDILRHDFKQRYRGTVIARPDTSLARERGPETETLSKQIEHMDRRWELALEFAKALAAENKSRDGMVTEEEFVASLEKVGNAELMNMVCGDKSPEVTFKMLDRSADGKLSYHEVMHLMDERCINFRERLLGLPRRQDITSFLSFGTALYNTVKVTIDRLLIKETDIKRIIGIHTDYVRTTDFALEQGDREFLIESAQEATLAFLRERLTDLDGEG